MKNLSYLFLFLILTSLTDFSYGQKIDEKLLYSGTGQTTIDAYSFYTDGNGNYAYVEYDPISSQSRFVSNKGNSDYYDVVNAEPKFDKNGNNYTTAYNFRKDTTYLADNNVLLMNGANVGEMTTIDSYNAFINSSNQYQCVVTEGDKQYIATYSTDKGLVKTGPYEAVKSIYAEMSDVPVQGEGDGDKMYPNLFKNKNGDFGYILIQNGKASIMFGNDVTNTNYTDISEMSFTYDKSGTLCYIGKSNGLFYSNYGNEFVVQGDKKWNDFNSINAPVKFNKDNIPVYVTIDSINESTYMSRLVVGNDYYKVMNSSKTSDVSGYTGGIYDINLMDNGSISFTGQSQIITKNPNGYDDYSYRTVNVDNGVEGKAYYNQGVKKYNKSGASLVAGSTNQNDKKVSLFMMKGKDSKVVSEKKYDGMYDYGFINGSNKYYYIGITYGDYEKEIRDKSDVYIDDEIVGTFENLLGQGSEEGTYNTIIFNSNGDYAFVVQNANEKKVNGEMIYNYTTEVISNRDVESPSLPYNKEKFAYIDNMRYLKNGKLFYVGYLYPNDTTTESFLVIDGKIIGKPYNSLNNLKYNKDNNSMTFRASRGNNIYDATLKF
jgi:hypothetical protein